MDIREKTKEQVERAKEFNRKPPIWAYVVLGIGLIVVGQILRVAFFH